MLWLMCINQRESSGDFTTYLGNGQPLNRITTQVPRGRGPFKTWGAGAADALVYDHVGLQGPEGWSLPWFLYRAEAWNGFGPRLHGRPSGYLWAGSTAYRGGKYVSDGVWAPTAWDSQSGVWTLAKMLLEASPALYAGLAPGFKIEGTTGDGLIVYEPKTPTPVDQDAVTRARWLQRSLNAVMAAGLVVDGSVGRHTSSALRKFQELHGLRVDGVLGTESTTALYNAVAQLPPEPEPTTPKGTTMTDIIALIGEALGLAKPHTPRSVAEGAVNSDPGELADALITAHNEVITPKGDGAGMFVNEWQSLGWHIVTGFGSVLVGSGLFDVDGPLAGMAKSHPLIGVVLAIIGPVANWWMVRASNDATAKVVDR